MTRREVVEGLRAFADFLVDTIEAPEPEYVSGTTAQGPLSIDVPVAFLAWMNYEDDAERFPERHLERVERVTDVVRAIAPDLWGRDGMSRLYVGRDFGAVVYLVAIPDTLAHLIPNSAERRDNL